MKTSTNVANRALQRCGATRIEPGALWTEDSKQAAEIRELYDSTRQAELRRNVWRFAVRRIALRAVNVNAYRLVPAAYSASASYLANTIVSFDGIWFISTRRIAPGVAPRTTSDWAQYFGPVTVTPFDSETAYFSGELVYTPSNTGYAVYLSTQDQNEDVPGVVSAWDALTTFRLGQSVTHAAATWVSNLILNLNNEPGVVSNWDAGTTYAATTQVVASDGNVYTSVGSGNLNHNPVTDTTHTYWTYVSISPWISLPAGQVGQNEGKWQTVNATLEPLNFIYPAGVSPAQTNEARNVFMLPHGFLREAPADPKAGSSSFLGAPSGNMYNDWVFENDYFVTREAQVIILRCVVDVSDVDKFDAMFFEGFACRIALEVCEIITQSVSKVSMIASMYKQFMGEARTVNGIETGPTEPPEDDLITCRQ